jgi:hypothetical protein
VWARWTRRCNCYSAKRRTGICEAI